MEGIALLTGFGPFGKYPRNPTERIVRDLNGSELSCGLVIHGEVLPSSYARAPQRVISLIDELNPKVILSLGYFSRIAQIRVETRGYNEKRSEYADCDGITYSGTLIKGDGPEYVDTNADSLAIVEMIRRNGVNAELSNDAERFICNCLIYEIGSLGLSIPFGYIHTPTLESFSDLIAGQAGKITIPDDHLFKAVYAAIEAMVR